MEIILREVFNGDVLLAVLVLESTHRLLKKVAQPAQRFILMPMIVRTLICF